MAPRTDAQIRASAQRKLARELKAGTFKPSAIGKKAREAAKIYRSEKSELIKKIREYKDHLYGGKPTYNKKRSDKNARINPRTQKDRTIDELRTIVEIIEQIEEENQQDEFYWAWTQLFDDEDYVSAFYYK
jgi:uncharacterized coiled-coil DUF342 family protein